MYKLILNSDTTKAINIDSFNESYSSKYHNRSFNANGVNDLIETSLLEILQDAVEAGLSLIEIKNSENETVWASTKYTQVENSNVQVNSDPSNKLNFSVTFTID